MKHLSAIVAPLLITLSLIGCGAAPKASTHMPNADRVTIVHEDSAPATIVLPAQSALDEYKASATQQVEDHFTVVAKRRGEKWCAIPRKQALAAIDKEIAKVGDEEARAADELQTIIKAITGIELPITRTDDPSSVQGSRILLGHTLARGAGLGSRIDALDKDGYIITTQGDDLILAGQRARGTLYAAYHLLESFGCRWVMPGEFGAIYPSTKTLAAQLDVTENPDHNQRYFWCTYGNTDEYATWTLRNRGNFVQALGDPRVQQGHMWTAVFNWAIHKKHMTIEGEDGKHHLPDDIYAMRQGKPNRHAPNFANPKAQQLFADYFIDFFDRRPFEQYVSLSATDGIMLDEHPESMSWRTDEFDFALGAPSSTDVIWRFAKHVIARTNEHYPDKKYGILVYSNNATPPRIETVHPQMALIMAPLSISPIHHVRDPKSKTNRWYNQWLVAWMAQAEAAGAETYYYDYEPIGYQWHQTMISPRWAIIGKNYPWFHDLGLTGHTTQGFDTWLASGLNNYLMMRLYWDADGDYRDVIDDYCHARFGKAASAVKDYLQVYEDRMAQIGDITSNESWGNHIILDPATRKAARKHLERAATLVESPQAKAQLQSLIEVQTSTDAYCDGVEIANDTGDFKAAQKSMDIAFAACKRLNDLYPQFVLPQWINTDSNAQYQSGGLYKQYGQFADRINNAAASILLPRVWNGGLDTDNLAVTKGWQNPDVNLAKLPAADDMDVTLIPDITYGTHREPAAYFYRTDVDVPANFPADQKVNLYCTGLIARAAQVWINGQRVTFDGDDTWRGPSYFWFSYDHSVAFDISGYIKPGQKNTVALRTFKSYDHGGSYRRIFLLAEPN